MNVLITGGAGFIGSHIAEECVKRGHRVDVIDDLSTGKLTNLDKIKNKVNIFTSDITKKSAYKNLADDYEVIFHVAARASIPNSFNDPFGTSEQNIGGTLRILEYAKKIGAKVIFSSSSSI